MKQYQIPKHIRELLTAVELEAVMGAQDAVASLRKSYQELRAIQEEGFKPQGPIYIVRGPSA